MMTATQDRRKALTDRLDELRVRLDGIEDELERHASPKWDEMAVDREEDEVLERMGTSGQAEIARIEAALARIEAGTYGRCVRCGAEISAARLDALPETPFCKRCAAL